MKKVLLGLLLAVGAQGNAQTAEKISLDCGKKYEITVGDEKKQEPKFIYKTKIVYKYRKDAVTRKEYEEQNARQDERDTKIENYIYQLINGHNQLVDDDRSTKAELSRQGEQIRILQTEMDTLRWIYAECEKSMRNDRSNLDRLTDEQVKYYRSCRRANTWHCIIGGVMCVLTLGLAGAEIAALGRVPIAYASNAIQCRDGWRPMKHHNPQPQPNPQPNPPPIKNGGGNYIGVDYVHPNGQIQLSGANGGGNYIYPN